MEVRLSLRTSPQSVDSTASFRILNSGTNPITITRTVLNLANFSVTLAPKRSIDISLRPFTPPNSTPRNGALSVKGNGPIKGIYQLISFEL